MATITAYSATNIDALDLSNLYYSRAVSGTSSRITVQYGTGYYGYFDGAFTYDSNYVPYGTLTGYSESYWGSYLYQITGLSISATTVLTYTADRDTAGFISSALSGADTFLGSTSTDMMRLYDGADFANSGQGADKLYGGSGSDTLWGARDNDTVYGEADGDYLNGNLGNDLLYGGDGADVVWGGQGNDTLFGEAGDDQIAGNYGTDFMAGGAGADTFSVQNGWGSDAILDFNYAEGDRIQLSQLTVLTASAVSGGYSLGLSSGESLTVITSGPFDTAWFI